MRAVDGVSLGIRRGETFAIVGESGCGKSTLGRLLLRLIEPTGGDVRYEGRSILKLNKSELRRLRRELQIIFQDPYRLAQPAHERRRHHRASRSGCTAWRSGAEKRERVADLLRTVGLLPTHADRYPHEFSGGQRQRIGIARALAGDPKLIIGDEPVSALDVSIQAQIINLLEDLKDRFGLTLVIVAHDLAVIRHMSDRVAVMYLGEIVELSAIRMRCSTTRCIPTRRRCWRRSRFRAPSSRQPKALLQGDVPSPAAPPSGCRFHTRCPHARALCQEQHPAARGSARRTAGGLPFLARNPGSGRWLHQRAAPEPGARQAPGALPNLARTAG